MSLLTALQETDFVTVLWPRVRPFKRLTVLAWVLAGLGEGLALVDPLILQHLLDTATAGSLQQWHASHYLRVATPLLMLTLVVAMAWRLTRGAQDYVTTRLSREVGARVYSDTLAHILQLPYPVLEGYSSGGLTRRVSAAREDIEDLIATLVDVSASALVACIFVSAYAVTIHWSAGAALLGGTPFVFWVAWTAGRRLEQIELATLETGASLSGRATEILRHQGLIKALGLAGAACAQIRLASERHCAAEISKEAVLRRLATMRGTAIHILRALGLMVLITLLFNQHISLGQFASLWLYSFVVLGAVHEVAGAAEAYRSSGPSLRWLRQIHDLVPAAGDPLPVPSGPVSSVRFEGVTFRHEGGARPALTNVSFSVQRGQTVAFVGPSASGKTTLVRVLLGLYRPTSGIVWLGNQDATQIDMEFVRRQVSLVTQESPLFFGSLRDNLTIAKADASDRECVAALRLVGVLNQETDQASLLESPVGESGGMASGGGRQRIAIARAMMRRSTLWICDEATSSLDALARVSVDRAIRDAVRACDGMAILVSHDLRSVSYADCIFVLERGHIVESGRHNELLELCGLYHAMWRLQESSTILQGASPPVNVDSDRGDSRMEAIP